MKRLLDYGYVRLVDQMGSDLSISRAARVSYDGEPREEDGKLLKYLMKNKHTSPFEAVVFTFEIKAPLFVFRQWHRHRTWSYNEVSARYTELPEEYYLPITETVGKQASSNKQMRDIVPNEHGALIVQHLQLGAEEAFKRYKQLLEWGCPRELARSVLPLSTYSRMFATVDLHNLFHFLRLRLHEHAQYEIRVYAEVLLELIEPYVPLAVEAFKEELENERNA